MNTAKSAASFGLLGGALIVIGATGGAIIALVVAVALVGGNYLFEDTLTVSTAGVPATTAALVAGKR